MGGARRTGRPRRSALESVGLTLGLLALLATPASASGPGAPASAPGCSNASLTVLGVPNRAVYSRDSSVKFRVLVRNDATQSCGLGIGPSSPSLIVRAPDGSTAWAACNLNNPCPQLLRFVSIAPGAWYQARWTWNQRINASLAPRGTYRVIAGYEALRARPLTIHLARANAGGTRTISLATKSLSLRRGTRLLLLNRPGSTYRYSTPRATRSVLVTQSASGGSGVIGLFTARAPGTGTISVTATPSCYPSCLMASRLYAISVTVTR